jgi:hypothetical protein
VQAAADQASTSPPCPLRLRPNHRLFLVGKALRCSWCTTASVRCEVVARHVGQHQPSTEGGIREEGEAGAEANARSSTIFLSEFASDIFFRSRSCYLSDPDSVLIFSPSSPLAFSPTSPDTHLRSTILVGQLACGRPTILLEPELGFHDASKASSRCHSSTRCAATAPLAALLADFPRASPLQGGASRAG